MKLRANLLVLNVVFAVSLLLGMLLYERTVSPALASRVVECVPPLILPTLQTLTAGARTDEEAYQRIVDYYAAHRLELALLLQESDDQRLRALFAMLLIHNSHPFGVPEQLATTFLDYIREQESSYCNVQSVWQRAVSEHLGLAARLTSGTFSHAWLEVNIDGHWESFDATTNTWVDQPSDALAAGAARRYRLFPNTDPYTLQYRYALINYGLTVQSLFQSKGGS